MEKLYKGTLMAFLTENDFQIIEITHSIIVIQIQTDDEFSLTCPLDYIESIPFKNIQYELHDIIYVKLYEPIIGEKDILFLKEGSNIFQRYWKAFCEEKE